MAALHYDDDAESWAPKKRELRHAGGDGTRGDSVHGDSSDSDEDDVRDKERDIHTNQGCMLLVLLFLSSVLASTASFGVDLGVQKLNELRKTMGDSVYIEVAMDVLLLCGARFLVHLVPGAAGSGIPEVKCILSGYAASGFFTMKVLVAKGLGLMMAIGSSLPLGKEGPFVHIAACASMSLMRLSPFSGRTQRKTRRLLVLSQVSVGAGCTFSAPIGGMIFALELMAPHMLDQASILVTFTAATISSFVYLGLKMMVAHTGIRPLLTTDVSVDNSPGAMPELAFLGVCAVMGILCGALAGLFVRVQEMAGGTMACLRGLRQASKGTTNPSGAASAAPPPRPPPRARLWRDLAIISVVAAGSALLRVYSGESKEWQLLQMGCGPLITKFFSVAPIAGDVPHLLVSVLLLKWLHASVSLCLPVPSGCVAPVLVLGAIIGRGVGACLPGSFFELMQPESSDDAAVHARLAIIGAAAFAAGVCRTVSVIVMIFELTAVPRLILPMSVATVFSMSVANRLTDSIFMTALKKKGLPALPTFLALHSSVQNVGRVLRDDAQDCAIPRHANVEKMKQVAEHLERLGDEQPAMLPIVEELPGGRLVLSGSIKARDFQGIFDDVQHNTRGTQRTFDLLSHAMDKGIVVTPLQVRSEESLADACLSLQAARCGETMMVVHRGHFLGAMTKAEFARIAKKTSLPDNQVKRTKSWQQRRSRRVSSPELAAPTACDAEISETNPVWQVVPASEPTTRSYASEVHDLERNISELEQLMEPLVATLHVKN